MTEYSTTSIRLADNETFVLPATVAQQAFAHLDQLSPGNPAFNVSIRFRLNGPLDTSLLEQAVHEIVRRHEVLRTVVRIDDGMAVQVVLAESGLSIPVDDLRNLVAAERKARSETLTHDEARGKFDLAKGPLLRVRIVQLKDQEHLLLVTFHHIIADGWSTGIFTNELVSLYGAFARGESSPLPELSLQYADFAIWQSKYLESAEFAEQLSYWQQQLFEVPTVELPCDRRRTGELAANSHLVSILLPTSLTDSLKNIGKREGTTFFALTLAALKVLMLKQTGATDITLGSMVSGRSQVELEPLIGLFVNLLPLRTDVSGDPTFLELLVRVRETVLDAFANQDVPFARVVQAVQPKRQLGRHPIFDVNYICQRAFLQPQRMADVVLTPMPSVSPGAIYDMNFVMVEREEGWRFSCEFKTDLFDVDTIRGLLDQYQTLLANIAADPRQRLSKLLPAVAPNGVSSALGAPVDATLSACPGVGKNGFVAPRNDIEARLADLWQDVLKVGPIGMTTDFFDAGGHSLLAARLLTKIEKAFHRKVSLADLLRAPTIAALALRLEHDSEDDARTKLIHPIQAKGTRTPLFIVSSQPPLYKTLASRLGPDQPMFGLTSPEVTDLPSPFTTSDIAQNLLRAVRAVQPVGPYRFAGWCVSGVIAYEMAHQLRSTGEEVEVVVLLDSYSPAYPRRLRGWRGFFIRRWFLVQRWWFHLGKICSQPPMEARRYLLSRWRSFWARQFSGKARTLLEAGEGRVMAERLLQFADLQQQAVLAYDPPPTDVPLVLFRSRDLQNGWFRDLELGWRPVAEGGLSVYETAGGHHDLFHDPGATAVAEDPEAAPGVTRLSWNPTSVRYGLEPRGSTPL